MSLQNYRRCTRHAPCPVCKGELSDQPDRWRKCMVRDDGRACYCHYVEHGCYRDNGRSVTDDHGIGWLHYLGDARDGPGAKRSARAAVKAAKEVAKGRLSPQECARLQKRFAAAATAAMVADLADELGVSREALRCYGLGWSVDHGAWTFPMKDDQERVVGFNLRAPAGAGGRAGCVVGSQLGLFLPEDLPGDPLLLNPTVLLMPEGASDCCALATLGLFAVGRPSNVAGIDTLERYVRRRAVAGVRYELAVVGENDEWRERQGRLINPGKEGALRLAEAVWQYGRPTRFVLPPPEFKDARAWVTAGATLSDVLNAVRRAPAVTAGWLKAATAKMARIKAGELAPYAPKGRAA